MISSVLRRYRACLGASLLIAGLCLAISAAALRLSPQSVFWHEEGRHWLALAIGAVVVAPAAVLACARWRWPLALVCGATLAQAASWLLWGAVPDWLQSPWGDMVYDPADLALGLGFVALSAATLYEAWLVLGPRR